MSTEPTKPEKIPMTRGEEERSDRKNDEKFNSTLAPETTAQSALSVDGNTGKPSSGATPKPSKPVDLKEQPEYKDLLTRFEKLQDALHSVIQERDQFQRQLAGERGESAKYKKDNALLRSDIVEMTRAREPLREENFFVGQFNELAADVESWAARETRKATLEKLSKADTASLTTEFPKYGTFGVDTGKWFSKQTSKFVQDRRNRIALIRHAVAIVLFDRVFDRFIFGFSKDLSNFFAGIERWICLNANYTFSTILQTRQAMGTAANEISQRDVNAAREGTVQSVVTFLRILVPKTPEKEVDTFARKLVDTSISLKDAMVKEQAIYRCYFLNSGVPFDPEWMKVSPGTDEKGKVKLATFPGLRRFNMIEGHREFVPVVKCSTDLEK